MNYIKAWVQTPGFERQRLVVASSVVLAALSLSVLTLASVAMQFLAAGFAAGLLSLSIVILVSRMSRASIDAEHLKWMLTFGGVFVAAVIAGISVHWSASIVISWAGCFFMDSQVLHFLGRSKGFEIDSIGSSNRALGHPKLDLANSELASIDSLNRSLETIVESDRESKFHQQEVQSKNIADVRPSDFENGCLETDGALHEPDDEEDVMSDGVVQKVTVVETDEGRFVSGTLRRQFPTGESTSIVHLPVYPPFDRVPECEIMQIDGPESSLRITQKTRFGVRVEAKIQNLAEAENQPNDILLEYTIFVCDEKGTELLAAG